MRPTWMGLGISTLSLAALACAPVQVSTQVEAGQDVSRYSTYVQAPPPQDDPDQPHYTPAIGARIQAEIDRALLARGYRAVAETEAEMSVGYVVTGQSSTRLVNAGDPDADYYVYQDYDDGTLVIDVYDMKGGELMWRGVGETEIVTSGSLIKTSSESAAVEAVRKVLDRFPSSVAR